VVVPEHAVEEERHARAREPGAPPGSARARQPHAVLEPELRALDPELRSIANVNTRADLARLDPKPGT